MRIKIIFNNGIKFVYHHSQITLYLQLHLGILPFDYYLLLIIVSRDSNERTGKRINNTSNAKGRDKDNVLPLGCKGKGHNVDWLICFKLAPGQFKESKL